MQPGGEYMDKARAKNTSLALHPLPPPEQLPNNPFGALFPPWMIVNLHQLHD